MSQRFRLKQLTDDSVLFYGLLGIGLFLIIAAIGLVVFLTRPRPEVIRLDRHEQICKAYRFWEFKTHEQVWQMDSLCKEQGL